MRNENADDLQAFICKVVSQGVGGVKTVGL